MKNKDFVKGVNDLQTVCSQLAKEWDFKNNSVDPSDTFYRSHEEVGWICQKGHHYKATVYDRAVRGRGCPYCAGKRIMPGFNDLASQAPDVALEWDYEENGDLKPTEISKSSNKMIGWKCAKGHKWKATPNSRTGQKSGCPFCSGKQVLSGFNDLATTHPEIATEWNQELNGDLKPSDISSGSERKVYFNCVNGHPYLSSPYDRTSGRKCPICAGKQVLKGFNDLLSQFPDIATEWDYEENDFGPDEVTWGSNKKVGWKCKKGHKWKAIINSRSTGGVGCPICDKERKTSFPEQAVFFYVKQHFEDAINGDKETVGMELDIYIPSIKTAIEYDGVTWHQSAKNIINEKHKNELCSEKGISLIRIREKGLPFYDDCICFERSDYKTSKSLNHVIKEVLAYLNIKNVDVNTDRDSGLILGTYISKERENSLAVRFPEVAKEWNYEKNGDLKPENVSALSHKKVWFTCSKGHDFQNIISNRTDKHQGCPYCAGKKVLVGFNDLMTIHPEIAAEWDYEKNGDLKPTDVSAGTHRKVWFKCSHGHSYSASIANRTSMNQRGCPECDSLLKRPVIVCIENGKIYKNSSEAGKDLGFHDSNGDVSACAKGKQKTAFGYHWRLATEEEKASIGLGSLPSNENISAEATSVEEFQLHISSGYKKIQFDSVRADAQNRMLIDKMNQKASPSIFTGNRALSY